MAAAGQPFHRALRRIREPTASTISFMSLNTLNDAFVAPAARSATTTGTASTASPPPGEEERLQSLFDHIAALRPTVLALQEIPNPEGTFGRWLTAAQYTFVSGRKRGGTGDHTLLCCDARRGARIVDHTQCFYNDEDSQFALAAVIEVPQAAPSHDASSENGGAATSRVQRLLVTGVHAKAGRTAESEAKRMQHVAWLMSDQGFPAWQRRWSIPHAHTVWLGDFNAGPHTYGGRFPAEVVPFIASDACPLLWTAGAIADASVSDGGNTTTTASSPSSSLASILPLFTTCKMRAGIGFIAQTIDYIWFGRERSPSGEQHPAAATITGMLVSPCMDPERDLAPGFLPGPFWGSDHVSVYCEAEFSMPRHRL